MNTPSAEPIAAPARPNASPWQLPAYDPSGHEPIRAELYGLESLEAHARALAEACRVAPVPQTRQPLLARLTRNERILVDTHRRIAEVAARKEPLGPDAEWLLDNFYVVEEVLREVRHDLPRGYYGELPKLGDGPLAGYPRVYALALALIAHTDSSLDEHHITRFVQAYQSVVPLTIGELWAVPTMLRLGILENLGRLAEQMLHVWDKQRQAEAWVAPLLRRPGQEQLVLAEQILSARAVQLNDTFIVRSLQVLRSEGPPDALDRVEAFLTRQGTDLGAVVRRENQRQAVNQVSVGNCITSLRLLGALDWGQFFEHTNLVEPVLRQDPAGVYERQDFATRDRCRRVVERLAKHSRFTEVQVARRVVDAARGAAAEGGGGPPVNHVGYYLLGPGHDAFKAELRYRPPLGERLLDAVRHHPYGVYFGLILGLLGLFLGLLGLLVALTGGPVAPWAWPLLALAALLPVSELAVGLTNYLLTLQLPPRTLPKIDFRDGIAADCTTFVVMPSMLVQPHSVAGLLERLEIHYLANSDPQLYFALLTDFADAPSEHQPQDETLVQAALDGIKALNERYAAGQAPRFFLLHRRRLWNPVQGCWMGWERKRGKLEEFNRLLRGDRATSYAVCSADPAALPAARFVITLDLDTQLPREAARRLVGTLAHPLNRARFDPGQGRIVEGYGVLQPRVSFLWPAANRSRFTRIWASSAGIDPYSTAVSDVYQDLFGAGTFTGKGIYDVDAFEAATGPTFPDNHILSHDLIEGNYARCGLVTDIELFDDFPVRYHAYARREHRWIRGDWQLLPWLGPSVPVKDGMTGRRPNPLPALERWKILDNLRRSLVAPALVLWLVLSWTVLPVPAGLGAGLALLVLMLPLVLQLFGAAVQAVRGLSWAPLRELRYHMPLTFGQVVLATVFVLHQAYYALDAIVRTLVRLFITRRRLLEWETAASAETRLGTAFMDFCRSMGEASAGATVLALLVAFVRPEALPTAAWFLAAWFLSPLVAFWVSQSPAVKEVPLSAAERRELRRIARRTWSFFETFVGDTDHWLPPDNFQEEPRGQVAHRTSPTNQGLLLLSTLAAHDLGHVSFTTLVDRLEKTFTSFDQLERYRGHFYNWYDTLSLQPLQPIYVSTVDSGNLLGCLIALSQGLHEKAHEPVVGPSLAAGLADTLGVLREVLHGIRPAGGAEAATARRELESAVHAVDDLLHEPPDDLAGWAQWLKRLEHRAGMLAGAVQRFTSGLPSSIEELTLWAGRIATLASDRHAELTALAPWLELLTEPPAAKVQAMLRQHADAAGRWEKVLQRLTGTFSLAGFEPEQEELAAELAALEKESGGGDLPTAWLRQLREAVQASSAPVLLDRCRRLAARADQCGTAMDFRFLYKPERHLFAIGYHVTAERLDAPCYDLLASEARLASFLAIARGAAPRRHWFHLGRPLTRVVGRFCLLSWGGTMFEYLMPQLLLRSYAGTITAESAVTAVDRQREYGRQRGVPWGISESAYSGQNVSYDYQYQSFGVPGLGLKRGLGRDLVIAPYATALAVVVQPHAALRNFRRLAGEGAIGCHGFYEAIDYTRDRLPEGRRSMVVRCFMAHHQGMSFVALANCLLDGPMPRRFHAAPIVRATELLLQERLPRAAMPVEAAEAEALPRPLSEEGPSLLSRRLTTPLTPFPRTHLLSGGPCSVLLTNAGSGFSRSRKLDVTRWREDATCDDHGQWCYIRDLRTGVVWSAAHQPVCRPADQYEVIYSTDKAEFRRADGLLTTLLEVTVSPEDGAEIRRVTLTNHDKRVRELELTSYAEIVLAPHGADLAHPAFGKLFLETEWVPAHNALLCRRRPRAADQQPLWAVHVASADAAAVGEPEFDTDRARFLGRGRSPAAPAAMEPGARLAGTTGPVLDPIFSIRRRVRLAPGATAAVVFCTAVADTRAAALALADHYHDPHAVLRAFDLAWAHSQIELRHLNLSTADAHLYQRLATPLLYAGPALRAPARVLAANSQGQTGLWRHGISGDRPIALVRVGDIEEVPLVRHLLAAHAYWRLKGLEVDLVILSDRPASYFEELYQQLQEAVRASDSHTLVDKPGGVFLRQTAHLSAEDLTLLQAAARVVLAGNRGTLAAHMDHHEPDVVLPQPLAVSPAPKGPTKIETSLITLPADLQFANGLGGFSADGREYCILPYVDGASGGRQPPDTPKNQGADAPRSPDLRVTLSLPPAPWINVLANPACGCLVSESGLGYTWVGNSQQNRLTPWSNDPVADPPGEVVYLRDEATGEVWTPTPRPLGGAAPTLVRHGHGYTLFQRHSHGLHQELRVFVPRGDPLKVVVLAVRNTGQATRQLAATFYAEWVLGTVRDQAAMNVRTELDPESEALLARNVFNTDFAGQVAFADVNLRPRTYTGDRTEFLGRLGSMAAPAALTRTELGARVGPALDPCAALQVKFELAPGAEKEVTFFLGSAPDVAAVRALLHRYREPGAVAAAFEEVKQRWRQILGAVQVQTPDPALDVLVNGWLPYQVLGCRVWGRSAFYQSGGAYGFRDQLQDVMALVYSAPEETRAQLLRAAQRQFLEGDVQHWWHPPLGRGVRTRISDDFLWLPFAVCHYVRVTGDTAVLDERVPYLRAPLLQPGQDEDYGLPEIADEAGSLYDHCVRALKHGFHFGAHGLPLMGTGDWNDGMNRVGVGGKGESVWNGWFLLTCLRYFADLAQLRGDGPWEATCRVEAERLRGALEHHAWDGHWYRRAYFDDGTPLGSAQNDECQIDSIVQSWAVLSAGTDPERARQALQAADERLVRDEDGLILLFTPPFDHGKLEPGYIKGYVPGIRENGGQYTHAATWMVQATALLGQGTRAVRLFNLLNPIRHAAAPEQRDRYKVEPYVLAGDVYGLPPHTGRGGWTWYTGSAAWLYRVALETMLGFHLAGKNLTVEPCVPATWASFAIIYHYRSAIYHIHVDNPCGVERGVVEVSLDGQARPDKVLELADDGQGHAVRVVMGG